MLIFKPKSLYWGKKYSWNSHSAVTYVKSLCNLILEEKKQFVMIYICLFAFTRVKQLLLYILTELTFVESFRVEKASKII